MSTKLNDYLSLIQQEKNTKIIPENIKKGVKIFDIEGTLSDEPVEKYIVRVIDYDGTVLKEEELAEGEVFTMPEPPEHDNLIFQGWSSPVDIIDNCVIVEDRDLFIGPIYDTKSGATEIDITVSKRTGLTISLGNFYSGKISVDWGDGSSENDVWTASAHTYEKYGNYTIKVYGGNNIPSNIINHPGKDGVTSIRLSSSITKLGNQSFSSYYALKSISLPNSLTDGMSSFSGCSNLRALIVPPCVTTLREYFVSSCTNLNNIVIPNTVESIEQMAFNSCYGLDYITLPNSITSLGSEIFRYAFNMLRLKLPNFLTYIHPKALAGGSYYVEEVIFPDTITNEDFKPYVYGMRSVKNVKWSTPVTDLSGCFSGTAIEELDIPEGVTNINSIVYNCYRLKRLTIPEGPTSLTGTTFYNCRQLKEVRLPNSIVELEQTFYYADALTYIKMPNRLERIGQMTCYQCKCLLEVDFSDSEVIPPLENINAFNGISTCCRIIVPDELYDEWIIETNWSTYSDYICKKSEVIDYDSN